MNPIWLKPMERWPQFQKIRESVQTMKGITSFTGVIDAQKCHLTASMLYPWDRTCIFITYDELQANRLLDDMRLFCPDRLVLFPAGEIMLYHAAAHSREVTGRRLSVLERLAAGEKYGLHAGNSVHDTWYERQKIGWNTAG
jgi:transcription-repair coupling factor (superfamily II helicase)